MRRLRWLASGLLGGVIWAPPVFSALYLDLGWDYKRGDFGTGSDMSFQAPWVGMSRYGTNGWAASVKAPYFRLDDGVETVSGLGDIYTSVSRLFPRGRWMPLVGGLVKWPLADSGNGLGTGAFDTAMQVGLGYVLDPQTRLLGQWGYTFTGDSDTQSYQDYASYGAGIYRQQGALGWSLNWSARGASLAGVAAAQELEVGLMAFSGGRWYWRGRLARGLSDGAADWSVGAALSRRF